MYEYRLERKSYFYPGVRPGGSKFASKDLLVNCTWVFPSALYEWTPSWLQVTKAPSPRANEASCLFALRIDYNICQTNSACTLAKLRLRVEERLTIVIWLILPVVICLSQRLSHACLSISIIQRNCEWLIKTVIVYLVIKFTWITVVILELIHA